MCCKSVADNKCSEKATEQKWELHGKRKRYPCDLKFFSLTNSKHWLQIEVIKKLLKWAYKSSKLEVWQNPRWSLELPAKIVTLASVGQDDVYQSTDKQELPLPHILLLNTNKLDKQKLFHYQNLLLTQFSSEVSIQSIYEAILIWKLTFSILPHAFHIGREIFCNQCN